MVTKCVCYDKLFSEMKLISEKYGLQSVGELKQYFLFGQNCKLCLPYVELMLKTGKTEFEPIDIKDSAE